MDISRFDGITRSISARVTRRSGLGLLAGASLPLLGFSGDADAKKKKITLCFNGKTIKKPKQQAKKLLKQGAAKGGCVNGCGSKQQPCNNSCIPTGDCCTADDCTGTDLCENGACIPPGCGTGGACTVFHTSAEFTGAAIGGLSGGDDKCQAAADAANLDGTFKAWLSFELDTPGTRFTNIDKAGPYHLVANSTDDGNPPKVADSFAGLFICDTGQCLSIALNRDENGVTESANPGVWTGTQANGAASPSTCAGWTSTAAIGLFGAGGNPSFFWTDFGAEACTTERKIYCFQQAS